jgi:hypothetical protein
LAPQVTEGTIPANTPEETIMEEFSKGSVTVPGLGKLPVKGVGLILFIPATDQNTLVLLADSVSELKELSGYISSGSLSGCTVQGQIAVCQTTPVEETPTPYPSGF